MDEILSIASRFGCQAGLGVPAETGDERVELAAEADAEGRIEERGDQRERGGHQAQRRQPEGEAGSADHREQEADELGELQRRHGLPIRHGAEPRSDERGEEPPVGMPARASDRADGEHHGLQAEDDGRRDIAERRGDQRGHDDDGGHPRREARASDVDLLRSGALVFVFGTRILLLSSTAGCGAGH